MNGSWGPLLTLEQWDSTLKSSGFGGIDTVTPDISASLPMSVYVAQAVDDRVTLLRNPLTIEERPAGIRNNGLAIIGGLTEAVQTFAEDISNVLSHSFHGKRFFKNIEEFSISDMTTNPVAHEPITVLCLTDLEAPYLEGLTASKLEALKVLWSVAGTVVWVTKDSRQGNPYSYMMLGITHTIVAEYPHLSVQVFDLEASENSVELGGSSAHDIATTLLRQHALHEWAPATDEILWSAEPEIFADGDRQLVTRIVPDVEANQRYNSQRREIVVDVNLSTQQVEILEDETKSNGSLQVRTVSPLEQGESITTDSRRVSVISSLAQSVAVNGVDFLRPSIARDLDNGEFVLALADSSRSCCSVPRQWCTTITDPTKVSNLKSTAASLIADRILGLASVGSTLLVHEAEPLVKTALLARAAPKRVEVRFSTTTLDTTDGRSTVILRPNLPLRAVAAALPNNVSVFVDFSHTAPAVAVKRTIEECLPSLCIKLCANAIVAAEPRSLNGSGHPPDLTELLHSLWLSDEAAMGERDASTLRLSQVPGFCVLQAPLSVVDWTSDEIIKAKSQPIDAGTLFRQDRTYLFVGMAGELGQSMARWMITHGARNVVLTSRNPKVNPKFIEDMSTRYEAIVRAVPLDITSRESLQAAQEQISAELPQVAGVVNGAMVLEDDLFANMTFENFSRVTAPKVIGTQLLDEAFGDASSLDFFVVASSIASIIGWLGQSNYSAANEYMTSLVANRRRRGLPG